MLAFQELLRVVVCCGSTKRTKTWGLPETGEKLEQPRCLSGVRRIRGALRRYICRPR